MSEMIEEFPKLICYVITVPVIYYNRIPSAHACSAKEQANLIDEPF